MAKIPSQRRVRIHVPVDPPQHPISASGPDGHIEDVDISIPAMIPADVRVYNVGGANSYYLDTEAYYRHAPRR